MRTIFLTLAAASLTIPATMVAPTSKAEARKHYYGRSHRYVDCRRSKGTTGTIAGGAGGAGIAAVAGAGPLGVVAAGVGGALLGRHINKRHDAAQNRRNGC